MSCERHNRSVPGYNGIHLVALERVGVGVPDHRLVANHGQGLRITINCGLQLRRTGGILDY